MKTVLLWLWQLPQNILGLLVILFTGAHKIAGTSEWVASNRSYFGVSLGNYVIFGGAGGSGRSVYSLKHEYGHQKQSMYLGPLYLLLIGLPSIIGNIYDKIAHRTWDFQSRYCWYYKQPWEAWADKLGGVIR